MNASWNTSIRNKYVYEILNVQQKTDICPDIDFQSLEPMESDTLDKHIDAIEEFHAGSGTEIRRLLSLKNKDAYRKILDDYFTNFTSVLNFKQFDGRTPTRVELATLENAASDRYEEEKNILNSILEQLDNAENMTPDERSVLENKFKNEELLKIFSNVVHKYCIFYECDIGLRKFSPVRLDNISKNQELPVSRVKTNPSSNVQTKQPVQQSRTGFTHPTITPKPGKSIFDFEMSPRSAPTQNENSGSPWDEKTTTDSTANQGFNSPRWQKQYREEQERKRQEMERQEMERLEMEQQERDQQIREERRRERQKREERRREYFRKINQNEEEEEEEEDDEFCVLFTNLPYNVNISDIMDLIKQDPNANRTLISVKSVKKKENINYGSIIASFTDKNVAKSVCSRLDKCMINGRTCNVRITNKKKH